MTRLLVTGASRGLGLALVRCALARRDVVFAACRSPETAHELRELCEEVPTLLTILPLDLLDPDTHQQVRSEVEARSGALDVLVNSAGIYIRDPSVAPEESHRSISRFDGTTALQLLRTNAVAPLEVTRALLPLLLRGHRPRIMFISSNMGSIAGKTGKEIEYGYSASKAALNMFARVLACELADSGVSAISVSPGWVATDMGTSQAPLAALNVARGLLDVIDGLEPTASGSFVSWQGDSIPW